MSYGDTIEAQNRRDTKGLLKLESARGHARWNVLAALIYETQRTNYEIGALKSSAQLFDLDRSPFLLLFVRFCSLEYSDSQRVLPSLMICVWPWLTGRSRRAGFHCRYSWIYRIYFESWGAWPIKHGLASTAAKPKDNYIKHGLPFSVDSFSSF